MIELVELNPDYAEIVAQLFQINRSAFEGYMAEEVLGWSISRLIQLENETVGLIQVRKLDYEKGYGVLGTWLVPKVWGTGINREAKDAMLKLLFNSHRAIKRVYFGIEGENKRSFRAAKKLPYGEEILIENVPAELLRETGPSADYLHWFVITRERTTAAIQDEKIKS